MKGEGSVHHSTVTRWFKKFCLGHQDLDDQAGSGRPKTENFKAVLQTIGGESRE